MKEIKINIPKINSKDEKIKYDSESKTLTIDTSDELEQKKLEKLDEERRK